jgi:hypothetical protein
MKQAGADDAKVLAYFQEHVADFPPMIGASYVNRLRAAGAGKKLISHLSMFSAVDIGEGGEGYTFASYESAGPAGSMDQAYGYPYEYPYGIPYDYAYYGGGGWIGGVFCPPGHHGPPHPTPLPAHPMPHPSAPPITTSASLPVAPRLVRR